ncbi:hypothetical protein EBB07_08365 [Paenibacillaceae bacterium]|nr:hypothetical protein EBB07_08365 [Paenibacillaceae bacterium]
MDKLSIRSNHAQINNNDPGIVYTGSWSNNTNRGFGDYNNDVHYTMTNNNYFEYTFTGSGIDFFTEITSDQGDIDIYIDNVFQETVSTHNATRLAQQLVYSIHGLPTGTHTFKAVKKSGTYMLLDWLRVTP